MERSENRNKEKTLGAAGVLLLVGLVAWGCIQSYPADRVAESIQEICNKEYGIEHIQVKIVGTTIGVYLPVKKLFARDFKEALLKGEGKAEDIENLFQPSPEALDQVEDVLFSISRVLLSTDLKIEFYSLQATDVEITGLQLVLTGYVDDIKRVRLWDISRDEYRKRVFHELRLNRAVISHRPVRKFFDALESGASLAELQELFVETVTPEFFMSAFFVDPAVLGRRLARWHLEDLRSASLGENRVVVHVPARLEYDPSRAAPGTFLIPPGTRLEYFFIVSFGGEESKILRVIPFSYVDETGKMQKIPLPPELNMDKDLESWETEFSITPIDLGEFLAEQLTRRMQAVVVADERIQNTFDSARLDFRYHREAASSHFSLELDLQPRSGGGRLPTLSLLHEDVLYLLNRASREFVDLLRSYKFSDYHHLQLKLASDPAGRTLGREDLELFRRDKITLQGLLTGVSPL
jgi:hypothetical protein